MPPDIKLPDNIRLLEKKEEVIEEVKEKVEEEAKKTNEKKEKAKKKKKSIFNIKKEKRLQYYSGWHKDDEPIDKEKVERQVILNKLILQNNNPSRIS